MHPKVLYLDNHSTTAIDPQVLVEMLPFLTTCYGNTGSEHRLGSEALRSVQKARQEVADLIHARPTEIFFTSGATESNNLVLKGTVARWREMNPGRAPHIVTAQTEHNAILDVCERLRGGGASVTILPVDKVGRVSAEQVKAALTPETAIVSVMTANNEIGNLQPIEEIGSVCKDAGIPFHTDAAQAASCLAIDVEQLGVSMLSLSAHKLYGPKGIGAIYLRDGDQEDLLVPQIDGGGQERGVRSGTLPVANIVGFGRACGICKASIPSEPNRVSSLRNRLWHQLQAVVDDLELNGPTNDRLPGNLSVYFPMIDAKTLMAKLPDIAVSNGAACSSAKKKASHVLLAIGASDERANSTIRFGVGRFNTESEIDFAAAEFGKAVAYIRRAMPRKKPSKPQSH